MRNIGLLSGSTMSRQDALITELPQQIYSGILILFNLLTLVVLRFFTRGVKLVLQIDVQASCKLQLGLEVDSCR
jgi:hypothetical protein